MKTKRNVDSRPVHLQARPQRVELPYWVTSTHPEHSYQLVLFENNDSGVEEIDLTRAEYMALKQHLAGMRGYRLGHLTDRRTCIAELNKSLPEAYRQRDEQQNARHLEIAREIYRHCTDLVVFESEKLDQCLKQLSE